MNFDLDEDQVMLRDLVERFMADRYAPARRAGYREAAEGFSRDNWRTLGKMGLLALPFGEDQGGMGGGAVELITVMEALGRGLCAEPYLSDLLLGGRLLERAGTDAQRAAWLGPVMAGDKRMVLAHAEPAARFNPTFVRCAAKREGADVHLTGAKTFVLAGEGADAFIVTARESGAAAEAEGLSLWLVPAGAEGLEQRPYRMVDGSIACELRLHGVHEAERLAGGADALLAAFNETRLAACAEMVGVMSALFDQTLEYLKTRQQFGQPIGRFQAIQHRMADLYGAMEQSRSQLYRAALAMGPSAGAAIAGAKAFIADAAVRLGETCIQFHGGMGVSDELAIGHGHKRLLLLAMLLGDADSELDRYVDMCA